MTTEADSADDKATAAPDPLIDLEVDDEGIELVFGLVGPTGVDLAKVCESLGLQLKAVKYNAFVINLSELITPYLTGAGFSSSSEYARIKTLMDNGTLLREKTTQTDIVARLGVANIRSVRKERSGDERKPLPRTAYIVRSFKRPEEVSLFRQIYGKAFTLISVYSPRQSRLRDLTKRLRSSTPKEGPTPDELAVQLIMRDFEEEGRRLGQRVGKTFPLADYFVTGELKVQLDEQLYRMVQLTFANPYISPTRDEQGMFFAQAAALRSLDLSRQVGAAILTTDGEVLSTGCNEVPRFGGGLYWSEDEPLSRDFELGYDSNVRIKTEIVEDVIGRLRTNSWLSDNAKSRSNQDLAHEALFEGPGGGKEEKKNFLEGSLLFDVIEFGRAVHAEAAAIANAARLGIALQGKRLLCTTFPCHICARHILASGIQEVIFIEPYEKSRTGELYVDSVSVEPAEPSISRANFKAFVGAAPRRYMDYFQMTNTRKKEDGTVLDSDTIAVNPKIKRIVLTYILIESIVIRDTRRPLKAESKGVTT